MANRNSTKLWSNLKTLLLGRSSVRIKVKIELMQIARARGHEKLGGLLSRSLERYGVYVSKHAQIGPGLRLPHPTAIVIGEGVVIGGNVTIYQSVTLGGRVVGDWKGGNYPVIGDGCIIFAGVVIVGKIKIGRNCVIGANSVVLSDLPDNSVAVGAPARIVNTNQSGTEGI